jgi:hypothetical protein
LSYLGSSGGTAAAANTTSTAATSQVSTSGGASGTHFGVPHLGIRVIAAVVGIGILLLVVARLVFRD